MTSFRFNFLGTHDSEIQMLKEENAEEINWFKSEEVLPDKQVRNLDDMVKFASMFTSENVEIGHVITKDVFSYFDETRASAVELANKEHSDLVAGKYEGGLKIWECTTDLIEYLICHEEMMPMRDQKVLDLGCGAGILGIYAFMKGAQVTFQDYNKEVLECVTIPNVLLNIEEEDRETEIKKFKFYSGDWESFNALLPDNDDYDIILTSETIYNTNNYKKLLKLFTERLKVTGVVYVAAKTYYFGVGGGTRQFETIIDQFESLKHEVCWKSTGGIQREIIKITKI